VIDVGCGSGILSIASVKLGASQVLGVDTDATAIESAAKNVRLNQLEAEIQLEVGSVEEILQGRYTLRSAPLVLANLLASILVRLLDAGLAELVAPGGFLILSGILDDQLEGHDGYLSMFAEIRKHYLVVREQRQLGDWVALVVQKNEAE
jgi:ribosomal protein L11 methyltransferase